MASAKNLIIARCGRQSLHREWLKGGRRNWDLMLCPYEPIPDEPYPTVCVPGPKWHGLHRFLSLRRDWLEYDYICMPDDDLLASADNWSRFFDICHEVGARLAQPAMTPNSHFSHVITIQNPAFRARATTFVENGLVCMHRDLLLLALPTMRMLKLGAGAGIDFVWPYLLGHEDIWIVDETPVQHTRPVGTNYSDLYRAKYQYDLRLVIGMGIPWEMRHVGGLLATGEYVAGDDPAFDPALQQGIAYLAVQAPTKADEVRAMRGGARPASDQAVQQRLLAAITHVQMGDPTISRHKPCTLSSVSPWSWSQTPAVEATGGNDGLLNGFCGFHTAEEDEPWWQVDLLQNYRISHLVIYNRLDQRERCLHLDVLVSVDGRRWRTVFSKRDNIAFGGIDGDPLRVEFVADVHARFVRVQARGRTFLHLDQVEVFGDLPEDARAACLLDDAPSTSLADINPLTRFTGEARLPASIGATGGDLTAQRTERAYIPVGYLG